MNAYHIAPPRPGPLVEALRGLGYSPGTAIADLVDNSIAAGATRIELRARWHPTDPWVALVDDGAGMDRDELMGAMRLGDRDPRSPRATHDLGRFGLGLKTASFSQCRRLTVVTAKNGHRSCLRWDLDELSRPEVDEWRLLEGPDQGSPELVDLVEGAHGTAVIWQLLDRLVPQGSDAQVLLDILDQIEEHLSVVFHRYLNGEVKLRTSESPLRLSVQGRLVRPWDPFLEDQPATQHLPVEHLRGPGGIVVVQGHVLPHKDRISPTTHRMGAGPEGWTSQQGFYVYRNRRLLLGGGWLGLGIPRAWSRDEVHQLARIRVDLPNTADDAWTIDVRKSRARPPRALMEQLRALAEDVRRRARQVFVHRGSPQPSVGRGEVFPVWVVHQNAGGVRYRIDTGHPVVQDLLAVAPSAGSAIKRLFEVLEESLPVQRIWMDTAEGRDPPQNRYLGVDPVVLRATLLDLHRAHLARGLSPQASRDLLVRMEPFNYHSDVVHSLPDEVPLKEPGVV